MEIILLLILIHIIYHISYPVNEYLNIHRSRDEYLNFFVFDENFCDTSIGDDYYSDGIELAGTQEIIYSVQLTTTNTAINWYMYIITEILLTISTQGGITVQ